MANFSSCDLPIIVFFILNFGYLVEGQIIPENTAVVKGSNVLLRCSYTSKPDVEVLWEERITNDNQWTVIGRGGNLEPDHPWRNSITLERDGLRFASVRSENAGRYGCTLVGGIAHRQIAELFVVDTVCYVAQIGNYAVIPGTTSSLVCEVNYWDAYRSYIPEIWWDFRETGTQISVPEQGHTIAQLPFAALTSDIGSSALCNVQFERSFSSLLPADLSEGYLAENTASLSTSCAIELIDGSGPVVTPAPIGNPVLGIPNLVTPMNTAVRAGSTLQLQCHYKESPYIIIVWEEKASSGTWRTLATDGNINTNHVWADRILVDDSGITIPLINQEFAGKYACVFHGLSNTKQVAEVAVVSPTCSAYHEDELVEGIVVGQQNQLICKANYALAYGNYAPSLSWAFREVAGPPSNPEPGQSLLILPFIAELSDLNATAICYIQFKPSAQLIPFEEQNSYLATNDILLDMNCSVTLLRISTRRSGSVIDPALIGGCAAGVLFVLLVIAVVMTMLCKKKKPKRRPKRSHAQFVNHHTATTNGGTNVFQANAKKSPRTTTVRFNDEVERKNFEAVSEYNYSTTSSQVNDGYGSGQSSDADYGNTLDLGKEDYAPSNPNKNGQDYGADPGDIVAVASVPKTFPTPELERKKTASQKRQQEFDAVTKEGNNVHLHYMQDIGSGEFGLVILALVRYQGFKDHSYEAAIKTAKDNSWQQRENLLKELSIHKQVPDHENVVRLLAWNTGPENVLIILEYMPEGDLRSYLRELRDLRRQHGIKGKNRHKAGHVRSRKLVQYGLDVVKGLEHLAYHKVIHCDLAARNILLSKGNKVCKISDFGMARKTEDGEYITSTGGKLPLRWMAPETLRPPSIFSCKSDVWAFGVIMWEIVTLGQRPYHKLEPSEIKTHLESKKTLKIPSICKSEVQDVIQSCWAFDPADRPQPSTLRKKLELISKAKTISDYVDLANYETSVSTDAKAFDENQLSTKQREEEKI